MQHNFYLLSLFFVFLLHAFSSQSQAQTYRYETGVPVVVGQDPLSMPWAGGLNAVQASLADTNGDRQPELVIFDRSSSQVQVFAQTSQGWIWLPHERFNFPADITNWLLMVDYDGDGLKDIFTYTPAGVRVFRKSAATGQPASWQLSYPQLEYPGSSGAVNLLVNSSDVPLIADTDGDGDIDIVSFDPSGSGTIRWYKNVAVEKFGRTDTLVYELVDRHWGGITECHCKELALNGNTCPDEGERRAGQRPLHAGGKSLLWKDLNGDGVPDLLVGDEECDILYYLPNTGTAALPLFETVESKLPGATSATDFPFPAAYGLGNSVLISTNLKNAGQQLDYGKSLWLYEQQASGNYALVKQDFLQGQQIEVGEEARPAFFDLDADGDLDLLIGGKGQLRADGYYAGLQIFENTGTPEVPAFKLTNRDFLGLAALKYQHLTPQLADYNSDGAQDLLLTVLDPSQKKVRTLVYLNTAAKGKGAQFGKTHALELPLALTTLDYPYYYDVTGDGLLDVLAGRFDGSLRLYTNTGTAAAPAFELQSSAYKGFGLDNVRRHLIPTVGDADADGQPDLIVTDASGDVQVLHSFLEEGASANNAEAIMVEVTAGKTGVAPRLGDKSWPVLGNLWANEMPALLVGQIGGGLVLLRNEEELPPLDGDSFVLLVYPNPSYQTPVNIKTSAPAEIIVYDMLGQVVQRWQVQGRREVEWLPVLPPAMYLVEARFAGGRKVKRLIIL